MRKDRGELNYYFVYIIKPTIDGADCCYSYQKTLFIQGVFVSLVFIFFHFRLQILCKLGFTCCVGLF